MRPTGLRNTSHEDEMLDLLAYLLSWSWWLPLAAPGTVVRAGDPWPTHMPGLLGPLLAALIVTAVTGGRPALAEYARRLTRWRGGWPPSGHWP
jgi:hypothetical protein